MKIDTTKLVSGPQLLDALFEPEARPCNRVLERWRKRRLIPYFTIGGKIWYDIPLCREAINKRALVKAL